MISVTDKEEIECEFRNRGASAASLKLLDRIPRRIENWYAEFVDALRACGFDFVANQIDLPEVQQSSIEGIVLSSIPTHTLYHQGLAERKNWHHYIESVYKIEYSKPCLKRPLKIDKTNNILMTKCGLMKVENIALEHSAILLSCIT